MRYFLRTLKMAWAYRTRLIVSVICATFAAIFWSLNFTAIYPILKILGSEQNLQQWVNESIEQTRKQIEPLETEIGIRKRGLDQVEQDPDFPDRDATVRRVMRELARLQEKLNSAQRQAWHLTVAKKYIDAWFPEGRFHTVAMFVCLVIIAVMIKGVFEFHQETLVGSVVNRVLYDVRNQFFQRTIKMDIRSFNDSGTHELMARFTTDVEMMGTGLKTLFGRVVAEPLRAMACVVVASLINWQLTLMFLVLVPFSVYVLTAALADS